MFRRRVCVATTASVVTTSRTVTTRGQFNPIHDFSVSLGKYDNAGTSLSGAESSSTPGTIPFAKNEKEFETIITNPGPIRVGYSPDYLNWLYLAYKNKVAYEAQKARRQSGKEKALSGHKDAGEVDVNLGRFERPASSYRRRAGEAKQRVNQEKLSKLMRKQGLLDLVERQPQFPFVDLANASRFHYVELFKDLVLNYYNSNYFNMNNAAGGGDGSTAPNGDFSFAQELWDKALLYRAILEDRRNTYPEKTFKGILEAVTETNLVPLSATVKTTGDASSDAATNAATSALVDRCPTEEQATYFRYLVKKYFVENAVEGHVVLKAHRQPNAAELLFCVPPPKDDSEVFASLAKKSDKKGASESEGTGKHEAAGVAAVNADAMKRLVQKKPGQYPPIEALWRCEENLPLLKILVFGELNLFVSENPFTKFPNALPFLTRPYASSTTEGQHNSGGGGNGGGNGSNRPGGRPGRGDAISLANVIAERRGSMLAPFPRNVANLIDGRNNDIRRQQQRFHREDILAFSKILSQHGSVTGSGASSGATAGSANTSGTSAEEDNAFFYGAYSDFNYYNPRTTRAEKRDILARSSIVALKEIRTADDDIYRRDGIEEVELHQQFRRNIENVTTLPVHLPTVPHFVSIIKKDPHISYLLHACPTDGAETSVQPTRELEKLIYQLARALNDTAMHYHNTNVRRVSRQKVSVAAALLDSYVERELARAGQSAAASVEESSVADKHQSAEARDPLRILASLGRYQPFANRALDETGYFTEARMDDYKRWMAPPQ